MNDRTSAPLPESVDAAALRAVLDGEWAPVRERGRQLLDQLPRPALDVDTETHRAHVLEQMHALAKGGTRGSASPASTAGRATSAAR